jgi:D-amino peptidase
MKIYISVDIEGVAGIAHWDEARKQAVAACEGALAAGATEIWIKDAHGTGRNIRAESLPGETRLIRGWSGHPFAMVQELDESFDAVAFVGWHGPANHDGNPLAHTLTGHFSKVTLNGESCSEYLLHAHIAALSGTPVVFLSGDSGICELASRTNPAIRCVVTNIGRGESVIGIQPEVARREIRSTIESALRDDLSQHVLPGAKSYELRVKYHKPALAYAKAFYPGARLDVGDTVVVKHDDFFEIARALRFLG